jgi:hypothetical protein
MIDDALSPAAVWTSDEGENKERVLSTIDVVLEKHRLGLERERRTRIGGLLVLTLLVMPLLWSAAHGVTPLVRAAYALMAMGTGVIVFAEWVYLELSQRALPGPADARSQLQKSASVLAWQAMVLKTAPLYSAPVFIGVALIALWLYLERTHLAGLVLWTITAAGWVMLWRATRSGHAKVTTRRLQMEGLLSELE